MIYPQAVFKEFFHIVFIYNFGKYNVHDDLLQQLQQPLGNISLQAVSRLSTALDASEMKGRRADVGTITQR